MKTLLVIQCRYDSTRLPGKALYPLSGIPMLVFLIRRLKKAGLQKTIVLATTKRTDDDAVARWGHDEKIEVIRGNTDDVLSRYILCIEKYNPKYLVRITADNPLTDTSIVGEVCKEIENDKNDYVSGFVKRIIGIGVDAFKAEALKKIYQKPYTAKYREHINAYILDHAEQFICKEVSVYDHKDIEHKINLTVDSKEDWERVFRIVGKEGPHININDAIKRIN